MDIAGQAFFNDGRHVNEQVEQAPKRSRQSRRRRSTIVQIGIVVAVLLAIAISWRAVQRPSLAVPKQLGTLKLVSSTSGPDAEAQINKLHGVQIVLHEAYIAQYAGSGASVTAWVAEAASGAEAAGLLRQMADRIGDGNAMFYNLQQQNIDGQQVYGVDSRDGKHYFYREDKKVIWIQVVATDTLSLLRLALKTL